MEESRGKSAGVYCFISPHGISTHYSDARQINLVTGVTIQPLLCQVYCVFIHLKAPLISPFTPNLSVLDVALRVITFNVTFNVTLNVIFNVKSNVTFNATLNVTFTVTFTVTFNVRVSRCLYMTLVTK